MEDLVIEVEDFRKTYGDLVAVDGVSFDVPPGEILGLLGANNESTVSQVRDSLLHFM